MKAGIVVAVEIASIEKRFKNPEVLRTHTQEVLKYSIDDDEIFVIHCGAGEIAASSATQLLISEYNVDAIFNFGVVGGLTEEISKHRLCVVESVVHYEFDTHEADGNPVGKYTKYDSIYIPTDKELLKKALEIVPELKPVRCASGEKFIGDPKRKKELYDLFQTEICEMEAAGIVITCDRNGVPCLLIKMVADGLFGEKEEYYSTFTETSDKALDVLGKILEER